MYRKFLLAPVLLLTLVFSSLASPVLAAAPPASPQSSATPSAAPSTPTPEASTPKPADNTKPDVYYEYQDKTSPLKVIFTLLLIGGIVLVIIGRFSVGVKIGNVLGRISSSKKRKVKAPREKKKKTS